MIAAVIAPDARVGLEVAGIRVKAVGKRLDGRPVLADVIHVRLRIRILVPRDDNRRAVGGIAVRKRGRILGYPVDGAARLLVEEIRGAFRMALEAVRDSVHLPGRNVADETGFQVHAAMARIRLVPLPLQGNVVLRAERVGNGFAQLV